VSTNSIEVVSPYNSPKNNFQFYKSATTKELTSCHIKIFTRYSPKFPQY